MSLGGTSRASARRCVGQWSRQSLRRTHAVSVALAALIWSGFGQAQSAEAPDPFALAPPQRAALVQGWGAEPLTPGRYAFASSLHARPSPSQSGSDAQQAPELLGHSTVELLGGIGGPGAWDVWGGLTAVNDNPDGSRLEARVPVSLGHARLVPRVGLSGADERQSTALLLPLTLPLRRASLAAEGLHVEPRLALSESYDWVQPTLNIGYRTHVGGNRGRELDAFTWIAGAVLPVTDEWSGVTELAGLWHPVAGGRAWPERLPTEARAAARFGRASWAVEIGAGLGLVGGDDLTTYRLFAAVSISPPPDATRHDPERSANPSSSLASEDDECAIALQNWNGREIPAACEVTEIAPVEDAHPCTEGTAGCDDPSAQTDAGCSSDGAVTPGQADCNELPPNAGADAPLPQIEARLHFAPNSYTVAPTDQAILDHVAQQMHTAPPTLRFRVVGHSDTTGPAAFNWRLSEARAVLVRKLLLERGVPWRRVTVAWYGPTMPLQQGSGPEIDAANRRVEFKVERKPGGNLP